MKPVRWWRGPGFPGTVVYPISFSTNLAGELGNEPRCRLRDSIDMYPSRSNLRLVFNPELQKFPSKNLWWRVKDSNLQTVVPKTTVFSMYPNHSALPLVSNRRLVFRLTRHNLLGWCLSACFRVLTIALIPHIVGGCWIRTNFSVAK